MDTQFGVTWVPGRNRIRWISLNLFIITVIFGGNAAAKYAPWYMTEFSWLEPYEQLIADNFPWLDKNLKIKDGNGQFIDDDTETFRQNTIRHIFRVVTLSAHLATSQSDSPLLLKVVLAKAIQHDREKIENNPEYLNRHGYTHSETVLTRLSRFNKIFYDDLPAHSTADNLDKINFDILKATFNNMAERDEALLDRTLRAELGDAYPLEMERLSSEIVKVADMVDTYLARNEEFNNDLEPASIRLKSGRLAKLALFIEDVGQHAWLIAEGLRLDYVISQLTPSKQGFHLPARNSNKSKNTNSCQTLLIEPKPQP